jgi:hypothetical protein
VTPYTSYLVQEPMPLGADAQSKIAADAFSQAQSAPAETTGEGAVQRAAEEGNLQSAGAVPLTGTAENGGTAIRSLGGKTFIYTQSAWTDTLYDPKTMTTVDVPFLSADYFTLAESRADLAAALALGDQVIVVADGKVYRVTAADPDASSTPVMAPSPTSPQEASDPTLTPAGKPTQTNPPATPASSASDPGGGCPGALMLVGLALLVSLLKKKG